MSDSPSDPIFPPLLHACAQGDLERAKTVAFALVSAYDHEIADAEVRRYAELIGGDAAAFRALATAMKADLEHASDWVRAELARSRENADEVIRAARVAMISDDRLRPREEVALNLVAVAVGLDPDAV
ncbi:MAG: hypothetical protein AB8I08_21475 [Sandaracinaceae bacterium]